MLVGIKKFTTAPGGSGIMLNTYRVISLSLLMGLFFAAPLLCIHPISFQIKKSQATAAKNSRSKRVRVVLERATHQDQAKFRNFSAAWARPIHTTGYELPAETSNSPAFSAGGKAESWQSDAYRDWDAAGDDAEIVEATSQTGL
jgi:hypothetical protein